MKKAIRVALLLALSVLSGCASVVQRVDAGQRAWTGEPKMRVMPPPGAIFSDYHAPSTLGPTSFGTKSGTAASFQVGVPPLPFYGLSRGFALLAWGDASEKSAAVRGRISEVKHVDYHLQIWFFVFKKFTTEVYGD